LWCYAVDDRPWRGESHPAAAYVYSEDHRVARPTEHLATFQGVLQVDGYNGFKRLAGDRADASVRLAFCWSHMRRGFYDFHVSTQSPLAAEGWHASARCTRSRRRSGVSRPSIDDACDKNEVGRS